MKLSDHMFGGFADWDNENLNARAEVVLARLIEKYGEPECGRNRAVFLSKNYVLKFPLNDGGVGDNDWEGSVSADHLAVGRWIQIDGFVCVMQERLTHIPPEEFSYDNLPDWVGFIDGGQVGYDRQGRLKAYDFGLN